MKPTTMKLSVETCERIRALGGDTYEDTIIEALDVLETARFWGPSRRRCGLAELVVRPRS